MAVTVAGLPPIMTVGVPTSPASIWPPSVNVSVVSASTALVSATLKTASLPSLTSPASETVRAGTSAPGFGFDGSVLSVSTIVALPESVMLPGRAMPLAELPVSVASSVNCSRPSNTESSVVGTVTTMPPVVPAGTVTLYVPSGLAVTVAGLPPIITVGAPISPASIWPPSVNVRVVSASTALVSATLKTASLPSLTSPASETVRAGTSAPGFGFDGSVLSVSTIVALPESVILPGRAMPLAELPVSVASSVNCSRPSNTESSVVGTVTTMPPVVPAGTVTLYVPSGLAVTVAGLPPIITVGVPTSPASIWPPSENVRVVSASTALVSATLKTASLPSLTSPASETVRAGTSAPGFGLDGSVLSVSTIVALPESVMLPGKATPLAVLPESVASSVSCSRPSKTESSVVGTVTTMPPVVPAGTVTLYVPSGLAVTVAGLPPITTVGAPTSPASI
ncbi:hypothetical protein LMG26686_04138 [Achromobacter mucicolens]|nr:hypothetical protein LMG26686_04138 [Achromobacter mucicolens]